MLHDHNDVPLFAIARTYSNWVGKMKFPLGPNRVFYLEMTEVLPGYVDVKIGFKPAAAFEDDAEDMKVREFPQPVPIRRGRGIAARRRQWSRARPCLPRSCIPAPCGG